jgi:hypothetical protein
MFAWRHVQAICFVAQISMFHLQGCDMFPCTCCMCTSVYLVRRGQINWVLTATALPRS